MNKHLKLVVQISHKHHQRFERISLSSNKGPLSIGRGWNNDIVLQDSYIDADHLTLSLNDDGSLVLTDCTSVNGSLLNGKPVQQGGQEYRLGEEIQIGDTTLTIVDVATAVDPTVIRSGWFGLRNHFSSFSSFVGLTVFTLLLVTLWSWAFSNKPYDLAEAAVSIFSSLLLLLIWAMFFGFISKLVRGQSNFRMHWGLICLVSIFSVFVGSMLSIFRFNLQSIVVGQAVSSIVYFVIGALFVFATLSYSTYLSSRSKWMWSALSMLVIFGTIYSDSFLKKDHERWTAQTETEQATFPNVLLAREPVSLDQYFDDVKPTFEFEELSKSD